MMGLIAYDFVMRGLKCVLFQFYPVRGHIIYGKIRENHIPHYNQWLVINFAS
jgi:hypothetical protein